MTSQLNRQTGNCIHCRNLNTVKKRKLPDTESKFVGKKFGSLTVLEAAGWYKDRKRKWKCICDCGKGSIVGPDQLNRQTGTCKWCSHKIKWEPVFEGDICKIPLSNSDEYALIDTEDYDKIKHLTWALLSDGYVVNRRLKKPPIRLARIIMDAPDDKNENGYFLIVVDHIKHNKLDNRKQNLRLCSAAENNWNRVGNFGVIWINQSKKYRARIMVNGKEIWLGEYKDYEVALKVRKDAEKEYYKEFRFK